MNLERPWTCVRIITQTDSKAIDTSGESARIICAIFLLFLLDKRERESLVGANGRAHFGGTIMLRRSLIFCTAIPSALAMLMCERAQSGGVCYPLIESLPCCAYTTPALPCIEGCAAPGGGPCCAIIPVGGDPGTDIMQPAGSPGWTLRAWAACNPLPVCTYTPPVCPEGICDWVGPNMTRTCTCHVPPKVAPDC